MSERPLQPAPLAVLGVVTSVPGLFGFFCPDVLNQGSAPELVHQQQVKATVASLLLGAAGSALSKTPWPFLVALAMCGILIWEYETMRRRTAGA